MHGAIARENPVGVARFRSVMRVKPSGVAAQV